MAQLFRSLAVLALVAACGGGSSTTARTTTLTGGVPERVDVDDAAALTRAYHGLPLDDANRVPLRDALLAHLATRTEAVVAGDDYDALVAHFGEMTQLLLPEDFTGERLPAALGPVARAVVAQGSPRGDEGRVLAGLLVLRALTPETRDATGQTPAEAYEGLARWSAEARESLGDPFAAVSQQVDVWDDHARLTPDPNVLETLARLHGARVDAVVASFRGGDGARMLMRQPQLLERFSIIAPLDVAAVYLRVGDLASALTQVRAMNVGGDTIGQLVRTLERARGSSGDASDALMELAEVYLEPRPEVTTGVCRYGLRRFPRDARFPACLARVAAEADDPEGATAWSLEAIERAPNARTYYDEALARLVAFLEAGSLAEDPTQNRRLADRAIAILEQRAERFPEAPAPVAQARIELLLGMAEMNAGNTLEARLRLEASVEIEERPETLVQLGLLAERTGDAAGATRHYRRALDLTRANGPEGEVVRARLLEHLGDAYAGQGEALQASRHYRQSLDTVTRLGSAIADNGGAGPQVATLRVREGILLDRLERHDEAVAAFRAAMRAAPRLFETYASTLSHLVGAATVDRDFAHEVFRNAQRQITLPSEWKVYTALWVMAVSGRAGQAPDDDVIALLRSQADLERWSGSLARWGIGDLPYEELLRAADGVGEETEAHFYEGARRLGAGDALGARTLFERAVRLNMVSFFEHTMARALLAELPTEGAPTAAAR
ncbi:MAG: tetratricopeptide repeat protein [Myxococcota bacterium]